MQTVKLFKVTITKAYSIYEQGTNFCLKAWGGDDCYYQGYDDGGADYILPKGYTVGETVSGSLAIYNEHDEHCSLSAVNNTPLISSIRGEFFLKKAS